VKTPKSDDSALSERPTVFRKWAEEKGDEKSYHVIVIPDSSSTRIIRDELECEAAFEHEHVPLSADEIHNAAKETLIDDRLVRESYKNKLSIEKDINDVTKAKQYHP